MKKRILITGVAGEAILRCWAILFLFCIAANIACGQNVPDHPAKNNPAGAAASFTATAAASPSEVWLQVDAGRQTGPVPYAWRAGVFLVSMPEGYPKKMFLADQRPGMVEFGWEYYETLSAAKTEEEFFARLPQSSFTEWMREIAKAGGEPYMNLMPVPIWLRSGKDGNRKLPRDWQGWERFVERMVDYFNNQLRIDARYIVWDEPNVSEAFRGTTEDYLLLYKHTAAGLLRANPKARIGGPAVSEFYAKHHVAKDNRPSPLLPEFIRYCANTPLPGLAPRLPIDMLVWHTFDAAPISPGRYDLEVKAARALLKENGYPENTELNIGSWSALDQFPELGTNVRDSEFLGAYVVASTIAMELAGVNRHIFFNLFEDWICVPGEFSNQEGLVTRNYITKAGYHAYHLLGKLQGNRVAIQLSDPFVQAAAARDGRTMRLIAANFAPPQMMLQDLALKQLMAGGHTGKELKTLVQKEGSDPRQLLNDRRRIEAFDAPPDVRAAALALYDAVQLSTRRQRQAVELSITIKDTAAGRYRLREFRVDSRNSNPYGRREAIDQSLKKAVQKGMSCARDYLSQRWSETEVAELTGKKDAACSLASYFLAMPPSSPAAWAPPRPGGLTSYFLALPAARQRDALAALELLKESKRDCIKEINDSMAPKEQNVSEIISKGSITWRGDLPPYGVILLEIEQID